MQRLWPAAVLLVGAIVLLFVLGGESALVLGGVAVFGALAVALAVMQGVSGGEGIGRRAELARAQRRLREAAQMAPGGVAAAPGAALVEAASSTAGDPARLAAAESALAESRVEAERLRGEVQRAQQAQRESEARLQAATAAATAGAEERTRLDAAVREGRAEVERLQRELEQARREPRAVAVAPATPPAPAPPPHPAPSGTPAASPAVPPTARPAAAASPVPSPSGTPAVPPTARPAGAASPVPSPAVPAAAPPAAARPASAPRPAAPVAPPPLGPPLAPRAPAAAPTPPAASRPAAASGPASGTLLLVDDDADFRTVAALILRRAGYEVVEAAGGTAALDMVQGHTGPIDLLITDMMMPGMNGRQLAQRFTKVRPGVRILYVSGVVDEASAREAIAGENADFLEKPFEGDAFIAKVRELLPAARGG